MTGRIMRTIADGGVAVGAAVLPNLWHVDLLADLALDFVWIDREHAAYSEAQVEEVSIVGRSRDMDVVVRVAPSQIVDGGRFLDLGATALMLPRIDTAAQAKAGVDVALYPPPGSRGAGAIGPANRYGAQLEQSLLTANDECLVLVQIETMEALHAVEEIAGISGVTGLILGPADLTLSSGVTAEEKDGMLDDAMKRIEAATRGAGTWWGTVSGSIDLLRTARQNGARMLTIGSPRRLLRASYADILPRVGLGEPAAISR